MGFVDDGGQSRELLGDRVERDDDANRLVLLVDHGEAGNGCAKCGDALLTVDQDLLMRGDLAALELGAD